MKNINVSVDDALYHAARAEAAKRQKSLSALVREFLAGMSGGGEKAKRPSKQMAPDLATLWALVDSKPRLPGSVGPLNREELHQRGISRH